MNKIVTYNLLILTKQEGAYTEFDTTANYDRMISVLVVLAYSRLGQGPVPGKNLLDSLKNLAHKIRSAYGDSLVEYLVTRLHIFLGQAKAVAALRLSGL